MPIEFHELLAEESPEAVRRIYAKSAELETAYEACQARFRSGKTREEVAEASGLRDPESVEFADPCLSVADLKRYVEGFGGRVSVEIKGADGEVTRVAL